MSSSRESTLCDYEALNAPKSNLTHLARLKAQNNNFKAKSRGFFIFKLFILARLGAFWARFWARFQKRLSTFGRVFGRVFKSACRNRWFGVGERRPRVGLGVSYQETISSAFSFTLQCQHCE